MIFTKIDLRELAKIPDGKPADASKYDENYEKAWADLPDDAPHVSELRAFLGDRAKVEFSDARGDYQGTSVAIITMPGRVVLWRDGFGSCSGCDSFCADSTVGQTLDTVKSTLQEGNTRQFPDAASALAYLKDALSVREDWEWNTMYTEFPKLAAKLEEMSK